MTLIQIKNEHMSKISFNLLTNGTFHKNPNSKIKWEFDLQRPMISTWWLLFALPRTGIICWPQMVSCEQRRCSLLIQIPSLHMSPDVSDPLFWLFHTLLSTALMSELQRNSRSSYMLEADNVTLCHSLRFFLYLYDSITLLQGYAEWGSSLNSLYLSWAMFWKVQNVPLAWELLESSFEWW